MFIGEYHNNLDEHGRLFIPACYKRQIGEQLIVTKGIEKCLCIYTIEEWQKFEKQLNNLSRTKRNIRDFNRLFMSGAFQNEIDSKGRINLDIKLIEYANLEKECVIIGAGNIIEIWSKENWNNYLNENQKTIEQISEELEF